MAEARQFRRTSTDRASSAGDEARGRILAVAFASIAEKGYRGTSIAQVAAEAGISQSGLLHHFPTKQALLIAVLDYRSRLDRELFQAGGATVTGWAALEGWVELARINTRRPQMVQMFVTLSAEATDPDHPAHEWLRSHYRMVSSELSKALAAGIADGTVSPDLPIDTVVRLTVAVMDGLQLQWLATGGRIDLAAEFAAYVRQLEQTWAITPPPA
ncbi:TetR/AcrR family transcriptional regulator [Microlunatus ginsengisoli]|uniref:TetR/AcrR family transcriptional regulator n=1 Tax=Microlunatus ginsengisoli TaxID=363863 RepID=A0ABP6ZNK3_9ACTN